MAAIKTAVSLSKPVYQMATKLARKMKLPRSRVVANAIEEYYRRRETQALVDSINAAYADGLDEDERRMLDAMRRTQAKRTAGDKW